MIPTCNTTIAADMSAGELDSPMTASIKKCMRFAVLASKQYDPKITELRPERFSLLQFRGRTGNVPMVLCEHTNDLGRADNILDYIL
jgi:hypothetical protein